MESDPPSNPHHEKPPQSTIGMTKRPTIFHGASTAIRIATIILPRLTRPPASPSGASNIFCNEFCMDLDDVVVAVEKSNPTTDRPDRS